MMTSFLLQLTRQASVPLRLRKKLAPLIACPSGDFSLHLPETGTYQGNCANHLDKKVYLYGAHEAATITLMNRLLKSREAPTYMDIGTNTGFHILGTSAYWDRAYGFEPNPAMYERAQDLIQANNLQDHVTLTAAGLSDCDDVLYFQMPGQDNQGEGHFVTTPTDHRFPVHHGDHFCAAHAIKPDVIKIDVEGHERRVLEGLRETIAQNKCHVVFEYNAHSAGQLDDMDDLRDLFGPGYGFYGLLRSRQKPALKPFQPGHKYENVLAFAGSKADLDKVMRR